MNSAALSIICVALCSQHVVSCKAWHKSHLQHHLQLHLCALTLLCIALEALLQGAACVDACSCCRQHQDVRNGPIHVGCIPGVQMRALQAMAVSRPPPRAMDATAATVGLGPLSSSEQKLSLILHAPKLIQ